MKNVLKKFEDRFFALPYWAIKLILFICGMVSIVVLVIVSAFFANFIGNIIYIFVPEASFETMHYAVLVLTKIICLAVTCFLLYIVKKFE